MILSEQSTVSWRKHLHEWFAIWFAHKLSACAQSGQPSAHFANQQNTTPPARGPSGERSVHTPKQHAAPPRAPLPPEQEAAQTAMTPLAWLAGLPPDAALIGYVDVDTSFHKLGALPPNIPPRPS